ncbi:MAG: hypothetical protein ACRCST_00090 [Turicibacter sp.]
MKWVDVKSVEELKTLGKFRDVCTEVKTSAGPNVKISGKGWQQLFDSIVEFKKSASQVKPSSLSVNEKDNDYFVNDAVEYIFYLVELEGDVQMKKLGIGKTHFTNKRVAKTWRDKISKQIHPDVSNHPKASDAMANLNDLYQQMTGRG